MLTIVPTNYKVPFNKLVSFKNVLFHTTDELFKGDWKKCPKSLKSYIESYDASDVFYVEVTTLVEDYLLDECQITENQYEKIMNWLQSLKILVYFPER